MEGPWKWKNEPYRYRERKTLGTSDIHVVVPGVKVPGEKPKFLLQNIGKTM